MDWVTLVTALIASLSGGGLISLLTIRETRKKLNVENKEKEGEVYVKLIDELQDQIEKQNERLDKKDAIIQEKDDIIADLRHRLDEANSALIKATLLKCSKLACPDRRPPLGFTELTPEEMLVERKRLSIESSEE